MTGWQCPDCRRRFKQRTVEHSCDVRNLEHHLERGSKEIRAAFRSLSRVLAKLGPHEMVPVKTMILLRAGSNFAGLVFGKEHLDVTFFLSERLVHPRVVRTERITPSKTAHRVRLTERGDVDAELIGWLRQAYLECITSTRSQ